MAWAGTSELKGRLFFQLLSALAFLACGMEWYAHYSRAVPEPGPRWAPRGRH